MKSWLLRILPPLLICLVALTCAGVLATSRSGRPERAAAPPSLPMVTVARVERGPVSPSVTVVGEVVAAQDLSLQSEVAGTLSWVDPTLHAGMKVSAGQVVARLDPVAFDAAVASAAATLASAEASLALELGSGSVAALEARLVGPIAGSDPDLVARTPQRLSAEAAVASAKAALASAKRQRRLTRITAPFDAVLAEESLDVGRIVTTSTVLGRWVGTKRAEIQVPVPANALTWFGTGEARAEVRPQGMRSAAPRVADSMGLTGVVDTSTRSAILLVSVDAPFDTSNGPALLPGSFAEVALEGTSVADASRIPIEALVDGAAVWSVTSDQVLRKVSVEVLWHSGDDVVIRAVEGLQAVIARPSGTLLDGAAVRIREEG